MGAVFAGAFADLSPFAAGLADLAGAFADALADAFAGAFAGGFVVL